MLGLLFFNRRSECLSGWAFFYDNTGHLSDEPEMPTDDSGTAPDEPGTLPHDLELQIDKSLAYGPVEASTDIDNDTLLVTGQDRKTGVLRYWCY